MFIFEGSGMKQTVEFSTLQDFLLFQRSNEGCLSDSQSDIPNFVVETVFFFDELSGALQPFFNPQQHPPVQEATPSTAPVPVPEPELSPPHQLP